MLRELILILVILRITNRNKHNVIIFLLLNVVRRFVLLIRILVDNYNILIIANIMKLGLFPFTHLILVFYLDLNISAFIILNICKLPYLLLITLKVNILLLLITIIYLLLNIYNRNSTILIIRVYSIISRVIILSLQRLILKIYYLASLIRIYLCLITDFEIVRLYNLISLPFSLTFYIKIQFLISLKLVYILLFVITLTLLILRFTKYITSRNNISKKVFRILIINSCLI